MFLNKVKIAFVVSFAFKALVVGTLSNIKKTSIYTFIFNKSG